MVRRQFSDKVMGRNFDEIELFIRLVSRHIVYIEWGKGNPVRSKDYDKWKLAWNSVLREFNASPKCSRKASLPHLYSFWSYLKSRTRKELENPDTNGPLVKQYAEIIAKVWPGVNNIIPATKRPVSLSQPRKESSNSKDQPDGQLLRDFLRNSKQRGRPSSRHNKAENRSRESPMSFKPGIITRSKTSTLKPPALLATRASRAEVFHQKTYHPRPRAPVSSQLRGEGVVSDQSSAFRPIAPTVQMVQHTSVIAIAPNVTYYPQGSGSLQYLYPETLMESSDDLPQVYSRAATPYYYPLNTQSSSLTGIRDTYHLRVQPSQTFEQTGRAEASYEKLVRSQKQTQEMLASLTKELEAAKTRYSAAQCEVKVVDETLMKRNEELQLAKIRSEQRTVDFRRQLHDIKMESARSKLRQAELSKQMGEMKLKYAVSKLQQLKDLGRSLLVQE